MKFLRIVGEDALCCSLGMRIVGEAMPGWQVHEQPINVGGITKLLPSLSRYAEHARHVRPVLCIADTDRHCPVHLKANNLPADAPASMFFRLAVPEAECWVLADRTAVAKYFQISDRLISHQPEQLEDAKQEVLRLARRSKVRKIREEVVSAIDPHRQGVGYNLHMCGLVAAEWSVARAADNAPSLQKTIVRLKAFAEQQA